MAQEATEDDPAMAVDKGLAYKKLSQTLGALLSRLETAQKGSVFVGIITLTCGLEAKDSSNDAQ